MTTSGTHTAPCATGVAVGSSVRVESALLVWWNATKQTKLTRKAIPPPTTHVRFGIGQGMLPSVLHGRGHARGAEILGEFGGAMHSQRIAGDPIGGQGEVERRPAREHPVDRAMTRVRWLLFASLAVLVHMALAVALTSLHVRREASAPKQEPSSALASLDIEAFPVEPWTPEGAPAVGSGSGRTVAARLRSGRESAGTPSQAETSGEPGLPAPAPTPTSESSWSFDPTVGVNPVSTAVVARAVSPQVREFGEHAAGGSTTGGLAEALTARDVDLGLGQGGQVLSAFEARARTMDVAVEGWAVFDVGIDSAGRVSVAVTDASTARDAWERVARTAVADVDARRIRVPRGARGWRVAVRIEAKEQYPDGERPKDMGGHVTTTGFKESKTSMVMESLPSVTLATRGKVCGAGVNWTFPSPLPTIVGGCNPENIGAREIRVVSGRIVDEGPL